MGHVNVVRFFTCVCSGPKHGTLSGCYGDGEDAARGLCAWCMAECRHAFARDNQDVCHACGQPEDAAIHGAKP